MGLETHDSSGEKKHWWPENLHEGREVLGKDVCLCGHPRESHDYHFHGDHCAQCGCADFRSNRSSLA